jgi:cytoskeletal protein RodZ
MKKKLLLTALILVVFAIVIGCTNNEPDQKSDSNDSSTVEPNNNEPAEADTVSSASQAPDEKTFEKKISKDGNFIIITSKDLTFDKDLTVDGTFTKKDKDGKEVAVRSLALATYGEGGKVNRYTLTVPRIIINSENTLLEYGIIKGDVYARFFKRYLTQINLPLI